MRCLVPLLLLGSIAHAAAATLVIGATEFPPFEYSDGGRAVGAHTELVEAVVHRMGYEVRAVLMPWARVELEAARGRIDIVYSMSGTLERAARYYFSAPISSTRSVFFKRSDRPVEYTQLAELAGKRIGTCADYAYPHEFMQLVADGTLEVDAVHGSDCDLRNLLKIARGRIDLFISDVAVGNYHIRKHVAEMPQLAAIETTDHVIGEHRPVYVGFPRSDDPERDQRSRELCSLFNAELRSTPAQEIAAILDRYGASPGREEAEPRSPAMAVCP